MHTKLSKELQKTRTKLLDACKSLDIDPSLVDIEKLFVRSCDNCGIWETPNNMIHDPDDSRYCNLCVELDNVRF